MAQAALRDGLGCHDVEGRFPARAVNFPEPSGQRPARIPQPSARPQDGVGDRGCRPLACREPVDSGQHISERVHQERATKWMFSTTSFRLGNRQALPRR